MATLTPGPCAKQKRNSIKFRSSLLSCDGRVCFFVYATYKKVKKKTHFDGMHVHMYRILFQIFWDVKVQFWGIKEPILRMPFLWWFFFFCVELGELYSTKELLTQSAKMLVSRNGGAGSGQLLVVMFEKCSWFLDNCSSCFKKMFVVYFIKSSWIFKKNVHRVLERNFHRVLKNGHHVFKKVQRAFFCSMNIF